MEETERLFRANEKIDPEVCGLMALGLFAGMRTSAIPQVEYEEIRMRQGILTPAKKTKKNRIIIISDAAYSSLVLEGRPVSSCK